MDCDRCHRPATGTYNGRPACGACLTAPASRPEQGVPPGPPDLATEPASDGNTITLYRLFPELTDGNVEWWADQREAEQAERARLIAEIERRQSF